MDIIYTHILPAIGIILILVIHMRLGSRVEEITVERGDFTPQSDNVDSLRNQYQRMEVEPAFYDRDFRMTTNAKASEKHQYSHSKSKELIQ